MLSHFGITTIYVTHDQQEAFILADLIAIMDVGTVEQVGTYEEIYASPKTIFVAGFLNLDTDTPTIDLVDGRYISEALEDTIVGVRPEDVVISEEMHGLSVKGCIRQVINIPIKGATIFTAEVGDQEVYARIPATENLSAGTDDHSLFYEGSRSFPSQAPQIHTWTFAKSRLNSYPNSG